ncbi:KUP/HAK/KT family potassium transporter [Puia dinghuensis]|uniref:Putative potassium transport system protein kup n=1 Tax=Puia dinghuensis TaxID=1792502 RepID=A0A8J2UDE5_9BACT|nr:KUP/HAK/KT family potassium transporter [Puia dinghuensis]GGB00809.1 putative potassium transport system protein kup [Puia dinghuensis]
MDAHFKRATGAGVLIALGIIYGDIGTSPLYTLQTLFNEGGQINRALVFGAISCIFWTLTLQTTFKYVIITLQADNHGEGGVFSLYALVRRYGHHLVYPAIIGAGTLLADGIITPPITVTSAIEGLSMVKGLNQHIIPGNNLVVEIVLVILLLLFIFQRFGTKVVGGSFGPIMFLWFTMLGYAGIRQIVQYPDILEALNPIYGLRLLYMHPHGFWLLGAIFLCTTGAEALYSDLGHCGRPNIYVSWTFVKIALVLNYLGQGAWALLRHKPSLEGLNPFFAIVPDKFVLVSVVIATVASIIASQALISGSFTLISEAISLGFWPRVKVKYPTTIRGQIYIPSINWILFIGCVGVVLYFRTSEAMTAAYGFSITVAMLMTTFLVSYFLRFIKKYPFWIVGAIITVFVLVESSFFVANAVKLLKRLFFLVFEIGLIGTMYVWYNARKITIRLLKFTDITPYLTLFEELSHNTNLPKYSSHLVYLTKAGRHEMEKRIIDSIFDSPQKRADIYWFVNIERMDDPYTVEYDAEVMVPNKVVRVNFRLGFRIQPRMGIMLRKVAEEMAASKEIPFAGRTRDFKFVILERFLSYDNEFSARDGFILNSYFSLLRLARSDSRAYGIDTDQAVIEKVPLVVTPVSNISLKRIHRKRSS